MAMALSEEEEIEEVLRRLAHQETALADTVTTVPVADYLDAERYRAELALLRRTPIVVGHASQLAAPGQFFTTELAERPLLLTRPAHGPARAFLNACRHRGTKLVCEAAGQGAQSFVCPYHAWTYHCDGRLLGIAHEKAFGTVDRSALGLVPVPLTERFGLLWLTLEGDGVPELAPELAAELRWLDLERHVVFRPYQRIWKHNWKLGIDGGLETYHFRFAHAQTIASYFFDNLLVYKDYEPSARLTLAKKTIQGLPNLPKERWRLREHANLLYFLFPNTFLLVQADYVALIELRPRAIDETAIGITMLIPEAPQTDKALRHWEKNRDLMIRALDEDFALGERIQQTLASGANRHLTFGRNESLLASFHQAIATRLS